MLTLADLRAAGLYVAVAELERVDGDLAVVGCEAVYADGTFAARRGTEALAERLPALVLVDRWWRIDSMPPAAWLRTDRHELVPGDDVRAPA